MSGSMIVAALLVLVFVFAGTWIVTYVQPGSDPWALLPWFFGAACVIVLVGVVAILVRRRR